MKSKKSALGRGLDAILQSPETDITSKDISGNYVVGAVANIEVHKIESNPFQPRDHFEEIALKELADSIKEQGIIQPVTVRKLGYDKYQLISGERRLKAAKVAGISEVPCFIRVANDQQMLELALIENIHRKDLNPLEIAISYQRLIEECKLTQEKLSERIGMNRTTVTNYMRLLKLPPDVQVALKEEKITMGHARALINLPSSESQSAALEEIISNNLSVREVEKLVQDSRGEIKTRKTPSKKTELPTRYLNYRDSLSRKIGMKVDLKRNNNGKGQIVIRFSSDEDLEKLLNYINLSGDSN